MVSLLHVLDLVPLANVPDPPPAPLPGRLGTFGNTIIGWMKTGLIIAGVIGILVCAFMIMVGRRQRNAMATEGLAGAGWVIAGLAIVSSAAGIVGAFI